MIDSPFYLGRRNTVAVIFAIAFSSLTLLAASASAKSYSVKSCDASTADYSSFGFDWLRTGLGSSIHPENDCPNGIRMDMRAAVAVGVKSVAWYRPSSDSVIKSVSFKYYGGDTSGSYVYTVRSCAFECEAVEQLVPGASESAPATATITMPPVGPLDPLQGDPTVALQIECVDAVLCADPPELVANGFELEFDDSIPPEISNVVTEPEYALGPTGESMSIEDLFDGDETGETGEPTDPPGEFGPRWIRGDSFRLSYDLMDLGAGVAGSSVGVLPDGLTERLSAGTCMLPQGARRCDSHPSVSTTVDVSGLDDGSHSLGIAAFDASVWVDGENGIPNYLVMRYPLLIDNGAPGEPTGLELSENVSQWGWSAEPEVVVSHDDASLNPQNTEFSGFKSADVDLRPSPNEAAAVTSTVIDPVAPAAIQIPHEGLWDIGISYSDNAGNRGSRAHRPVGFDVDSPERPDPSPHDWISLDELHAGIDQTWTAPPADDELESGVCAYAFSVDDELLGIPSPTADVLAPKTSALIPSGIGEGNHFAHVRTIACNGKPSLTETVPVNVDGSAPVPVLHGVSPAEWLTSPPSASLSATDAHSGVAGMEFGFDGPEGALNLVPGSSTPVVIPQGERTISYRAIDIAGNASPLVNRQIRADWTPPGATLAPRDPARPGSLTARVEDAHSGLAGLGMQIRRTDSGASALEAGWKALGGFETIGDPGAKSKTITRQIPDGELADGSYEVRVMARDVAGNWSDPSSIALQLALPIRSKPVLTAAIAGVGKKSKVNWSGASQDRVVLYGKPTALVGSLLDGARRPVPDAQISVTATPEFGVPGTPRVITSDARGEFVLRLPKGPTRRFDLHFDGNDRLQPIDQTADIRVRAALDFRVNPKVVRSGRSFVFTGRLRSASVGLPEGGKLVLIDYRRRNKWFTIDSDNVDSRGRFRVTWPGVEARKTTTVYFRARAKRDGAWPFLTGSSKSFALRVKP